MNRADFEGKRLRSPLNPNSVAEIKGSWHVSPVGGHDRRRIALLLETGETAYADKHGALLGGWAFADGEAQP